ncbi:MAG: hypothetical protein C5B50_26310 [Verrucomicrobia bacterium]|nr:MAG: hypothetical protein C5B50_26310 [Verrucomicrobiota bacterium]
MRSSVAVIGISLACVWGCAHHYGGSPGPEAPLNPPLAAEPAPQEPRPLVNEAPPAPAPPGVSTMDISVGKAVSQLLKEDEELSGVSGNVEAGVEHGVVTLRGNVPSEHDRIEMVERISKLPGVARVEDKLRVTGEQ